MEQGGMDMEFEGTRLVDVSAEKVAELSSMLLSLKQKTSRLLDEDTLAEVKLTILWYTLKSPKFKDPEQHDVHERVEKLNSYFRITNEQRERSNKIDDLRDRMVKLENFLSMAKKKIESSSQPSDSSKVSPPSTSQSSVENAADNASETRPLQPIPEDTNLPSTPATRSQAYYLEFCQRRAKIFHTKPGVLPPLRCLELQSSTSQSSVENAADNASETRQRQPIPEDMPGPNLPSTPATFPQAYLQFCHSQVKIFNTRPGVRSPFRCRRCLELQSRSHSGADENSTENEK